MTKTGKILVAAPVVVLAVVIRVELYPFQSGDYRAFSAQWYDFVKANGGFSALRYQFADYNVPYLYLIALLTYLPVPALAGIKTISVLFDLLLAFYTYKLVALKYPRGWIPFAAAAVVALLPTVVMNGSMWAQCDSIYAAFGLGGLYYAVRSRPWLACVFFGLALAVKLQIVFLLPVLAVLALARKIPWPALLAVPGVVLALDIPALLVGANPADLLTVYTNQVGEYSRLTLNAANVYQFFDFGTDTGAIRTAGVLITAVLVVALIAFAVWGRPRLTVSRVVLLGCVFAILIPFFLPAMHERYFYLADVLSVIVAFYHPRRLWPVPVLVQFASAFSYLPFLLREGTVVAFWVLASAMLVALLLVLQVQLQPHQQHEQQRATQKLPEHVGRYQAER
ncbi:glycosyltransferase 87 family protein [Actinocrispum wychmicini]|uniref:Gpi18-like mannosyltransferase n=1 Tax=Actinocrispum wychmicini TaxID=1213861 RepID=A0A4R2J2W1_9PSEU|nr:glycosyltransferase 87 family protein [Actinocrispum wychmicini]TCO50639.1 Gpi18-like mannosyltransferase [Actinocrispum wychmicini]